MTLHQIALSGRDAAMRMTSREIADLAGKEHKNVLADIRKVLADLGMTSAEFSADVPDGYGRPQPGFKLPKRETLILVSGYSVAMRAKIIDRWQELEAQVVARIPQTMPEALRLASRLLSNVMVRAAIDAGLAELRQKSVPRCVPRCVPTPCVPAIAWKPRLETTDWKPAGNCRLASRLPGHRLAVNWHRVGRLQPHRPSRHVLHLRLEVHVHPTWSRICPPVGVAPGCRWGRQLRMLCAREWPRHQEWWPKGFLVQGDGRVPAPIQLAPGLGDPFGSLLRSRGIKLQSPLKLVGKLGLALLLGCSHTQLRGHGRCPIHALVQVLWFAAERIEASSH
ncbi:MAG: hypothetical protein RI907_996 [Pseudomonadota bacterium]|jgi:phage regulator Rha-like protein